MAGKPSPDNLREVRVVIYMTEHDAQFLNELSEDLGFRSRSGLIVSMLERFIEGGFSVLIFALVGAQLQKLATKRRIREGGWYLGKPKSLLPDLNPQDLTAKQRKAVASAEKAFEPLPSPQK